MLNAAAPTLEKARLAGLLLGGRAHAGTDARGLPKLTPSKTAEVPGDSLPQG